MPNITPRQEELLAAIIKEYTTTAKPISSSWLVDREDLDVSPATVRNDMAALETAGYLMQPHTSAGRVPTEQAWRWYVQRMTPAEKVGKREQEQLSQVAKEYRHSDQEMLRQLAKTMADIIAEAVIVAFDKNDTYYTGISNLFRQPEFTNLEVIQDLSQVVDRMDEVMDRVFERVADVQILVGKENPFSQTCGVVLARYHIPHKHSGVLGILGPMRQDYSEHRALMRYTQDLLQTVK